MPLPKLPFQVADGLYCCSTNSRGTSKHIYHVYLPDFRELHKEGNQVGYSPICQSDDFISKEKMENKGFAADDEHALDMTIKEICGHCAKKIKAYESQL